MNRHRTAGAHLADFEANLTRFIRGFGLLQADRTPCGQPLPVSVAHAISVIAEQKGISQSELTRTLRLARATVSEVLADLETRGWIRRTRSGADRRVLLVELTDTGTRIASEVATARRALFARILDDLEPAERETLIGALGLLAERAEAVPRSETDDVSASGRHADR